MIAVRTQCKALALYKNCDHGYNSIMIKDQYDYDHNRSHIEYYELTVLDEQQSWSQCEHNVKN